ncbi:hypothetical protein TCAL_04013 [Tigriopus californicus]|uniref:Uncharacterized protein n=2 Tax=Tigriopus californicus TaxID=6832 RepID=A0A553NCP6_TIGCA|nr:hypothetical protein TCAL_04013 [Tigriopus californicus]|eukprot:TCALIF_04013-PA protein Name:"Protein of unknown function" AED:0.00 eAED:0.00 QI:167/1/1/1/1/1/2/225/181
MAKIFFNIATTAITLLLMYSGHVYGSTGQEHFLRPLRSEIDNSGEDAFNDEYGRDARSSGSHFLRPLRSPLEMGLTDDDLAFLSSMVQDQDWAKRGQSHFLRSLRSPSDTSHFLRSLRGPSDNAHFLRSLKSSEGNHFLRSLRGGENHFLRALKSGNSHFLRSLRSPDSDKRSTTHFLRTL